MRTLHARAIVSLDVLVCKAYSYVGACARACSICPVKDQPDGQDNDYDQTL